MTIKNFEDLEVWKDARILCKMIRTLVSQNDFSKEYKFKEQITSSSGSIMDCIAEGFERDGKKEFIQFLSIAKGSCGETRSQLYRAYDALLISELQFKETTELSISVSKRIAALIKYLKDSDYPGTKFK